MHLCNMFWLEIRLHISNQETLFPCRYGKRRSVTKYRPLVLRVIETNSSVNIHSFILHIYIWIHVEKKVFRGYILFLSIRTVILKNKWFSISLHADFRSLDKFCFSTSTGCLMGFWLNTVLSKHECYCPVLFFLIKMFAK